MSVLVEFSMIPLDQGPSFSASVARILDHIDRSGVSYQLGPMGTCLEGEWDEVFSVIQECYQLLEADCDRISCSIKVDARKGVEGRLEGKVQKTTQTLGRPLQT